MLPLQTAQKLHQDNVNKLGAFNLAMSGREKKKDEYQPDNGEVVMGRNFTSSDKMDHTLGKAFDDLLVQKNTDLLNAGNEASFGTPGV